MDNNKQSTYEEMISRYLSGESTDREAKELMQLLETNQEVKEVFVQFENIWKLSDEYAYRQRLDSDKAMQSFMDKAFPKEEGNVVSITSKQKFVSGLFKIAAMLVLAFGAYFFIHRFIAEVEYSRLAAGADKNLHTELVDGSKITLNKNAVIEYHKDFLKKRELRLQGEAFFDVESLPGKDFTIEAGEVKVRVVGTSFNVKVSPDNTTTEVKVRTGIVEVFKDDESLARLTANESLSYANDSISVCSADKFDENDLFWISKKLAFQNTPLSQVVKKINESYSVNIIFAEEKTKHCKLTAEFENKELQEILEVLQYTFALEVEQQNEKYILTGEGCIP